MNTRTNKDDPELRRAVDRLGEGVRAKADKRAGVRRRLPAANHGRTVHDVYHRSDEAIEAAKALRDRMVPDN